jgi:competence protein ComEC
VTPHTSAGAHRVVRHDVRLVPAAMLTWGVAWWAVAAPSAQTRVAAWVLLSAAAVALLVLVATRAAHGADSPRVARGAVLQRVVRDAVPLVVVACSCAGMVLSLTAWQHDRRHPEVVTSVADRSGVLTADVVVVGDPVTGRGTQPWQQEQVRVRVVLERVGVPGLGTQGPGGPGPTGTGAGRAVRVPASLTGDQEWADARWGERVTVPLRLERAPPGAPWTVFARVVGPAAPVAEPRWWWRAAERLRSGLVVAAGADGADGGDGAVLLPGLVVGDTSAQPPDLADDMRTAGLTHLTAVSGANVTIICGGVLLVCVLLRVDRRAAVILAAGALAALVVVARPEPSVLRAALMGTVGLLGLLVGRRGGGLSALAAAVLAVLVVDPWLARAPGFRLSVLATGALVVWSMPWARALGRVLPRSLALVVSVPAAAQVAVTPSLVGLEPQVSLYALPANVMAAPAVAPATVVGVVAALVSLVHPAAATVLALPAVWCAGWIALVARTTARLPAAVVPWPEGAVGAVAAAAVAALLVVGGVLLLRRAPDRRGPDQAWAPWPDPRVWSGRLREVRVRAVVAVTAAVAIAVALLVTPLPGVGRPGVPWTAVVCDVGQGESLLVRAGEDSAVVVDTGPEPGPVAGCLRRAGVRHVPLLVLTHLHADHVGGLTGVHAAARVGQVWSPATGMPAAAVERLAGWSADSTVPSEHPVAGTVVDVGRVRVEVLAPRAPGPAALAPGGTGGQEPQSQQVNDGGLVLRLAVDGITVLVLGDIGSSVQQRLLDGGAALRADVTTVAHHGSADQLPAFYAAVGATVAVASAGRDNGYGHPSPTARAVVAAAGSRVLSTAEHGDVALRVVDQGSDGAGGEGLPPAMAVRTTRAAPRRHRAVPACRRG